MCRPPTRFVSNSSTFFVPEGTATYRWCRRRPSSRSTIRRFSSRTPAMNQVQGPSFLGTGSRPFHAGRRHAEVHPGRRQAQRSRRRRQGYLPPHLLRDARQLELRRFTSRRKRSTLGVGAPHRRPEARQVAACTSRSFEGDPREQRPARRRGGRLLGGELCGVPAEHLPLRQQERTNFWEMGEKPVRAGRATEIHYDPDARDQVGRQAS